MNHEVCRTSSFRTLGYVVVLLCEDCRRHGVVQPAAQVDHVLGLVLRPDLAYDLANTQSLCTACHARKSAAERRARRGIRR